MENQMRAGSQMITTGIKASRVKFYHTVTFWEFDDMDYDRTQVPLTSKLTNSDLTEYMQVINAGRNGRFIIDEESNQNLKIMSANTHLNTNSPYKSSLKQYNSQQYNSQRRKTL